jgi:hypothetical protein
MSHQKQERQKARNPAGRYEEMARCEDCGKPVGSNYFSMPGSEITGDGFSLCGKCINARTAHRESGV